MNTIDLTAKRQPVRVTEAGCNNQLLYFTSSSLTADDKELVLISDRTGDYNLFVQDLASGDVRQLTHNNESYLKSYVYFDGTPYKGFGRASVSLDVTRGRVYYIQGREVRCVDLTRVSEATLAVLPDNQVTGFTHVSDDGRLLCVPTTDARALDDEILNRGPMWEHIDKCVQEENLSSYLNVFDTATGERVLCERVPKAWVTHVQFSPNDNSKILYNHEWCSDGGIRRMWLWDGQRHLRLRTEGDGRSRKDFTCHEMWERDGSALVYHGGRHDGPSYIGRVRPDGTNLCEILLPESYKHYGHYMTGKPAWLVTDGSYVPDGDTGDTWGGKWICLLKVDWAGQKAHWMPLCEHGSCWSCQDVHPHPIFDHSGTNIYFTSDVEGYRAVYRLDVADLVNQ